MYSGTYTQMNVLHTGLAIHSSKTIGALPTLKATPTTTSAAGAVNNSVYSGLSRKNRCGADSSCLVS